MITVNYFTDKLGLDKKTAQEVYNKINNSAVQGILRFNEETLDQRFDYLQNELGISVDRILMNFRLLSMDTASTSETSIKTKSAFLRKTLGFENKQFQLNPSIFCSSIESLNEKILYLKQTLGFSNKEFKKCPIILNFEIETLKQKIDYFVNELHFTKKDIASHPTILQFDCSSDNPQSIKGKVDFYYNTLGLTPAHLRKAPALLCYDCIDETRPTSIKSKIKFFKEELGFGNREFQINPCLLQCDCISDESVPTSIKGKMKFFKDTLGFENEHLKKAPTLFSFDCSSDTSNPTALINKIKFLLNEVGLTKENLKKDPTLLNFDCISDESNPKGIKSKLKVLKEIGITTEDIQKNTKYLRTPAYDLKDKYILWCNIFPDKSFIDLNGWFITTKEKIYARYIYLRDDVKVENIRPFYLDLPEHTFNKRFKTPPENLQNIYILDKKTLEELRNNFKNLNLNNEQNYKVNGKNHEKIFE